MAAYVLHAHLSIQNTFHFGYMMGFITIVAAASFFILDTKEHLFFCGVAIICNVFLLYTYGPIQTLTYSIAHQVTVLLVCHLVLRLINYILDQMEAREEELVKERNGALMLGNLASQAAHDLRSPLSTLDTIMQQMQSAQPEIKEILSVVKQKIDSTCNDLLSVSKEIHEATKTENIESLELIDIKELIVAVSLERKLVSKTQITYRIEEGPSTIKVKGNRSSLLRTLTNLINNSVEAAGADSSIFISAKASAGKISIELTDNGPGVPQSVLDSLGNPFNTKGKKKGTGLGLYFAKLSVESWGGTFSIQNQNPNGTKVNITLKS